MMKGFIDRQRQLSFRTIWFLGFFWFTEFIGLLKLVVFFGVIVFDYLIPGLSFFLSKSRKTEISEQALSTVPGRFATRTAIFL